MSEYTLTITVRTNSDFKSDIVDSVVKALLEVETVIAVVDIKAVKS